MSQSAVPPVARQEKQSVMETVALAIDPSGRCSLQNAPSAARIPRYPLNRVGTSRCTVAIATVKSEPADSAGLTLRAYTGGVLHLCMSLECLRCYVVSSLPARRRNTGLFTEAFPKKRADERCFARGKGSQPFCIQRGCCPDKGKKCR